MMYHSDAKVLHFLKKVQQDEACFVSVNTDFCSAVHCKSGFDSEAHELAWKTEYNYRLKMPVSSFRACLKSLQHLGFIEKPHSGSIYQVTHDGWNQEEVIKRERREFLITHALFPCFVSVCTTALIWLIKSLLSGKLPV